MTTLIASTKERTAGAAARLGLVWGVGHALALFAFGLPIVLFKAYLPHGVQQGAETTVGLMIIALAVWLLVRWRRGVFHLHLHEHDSDRHLHGHSHTRPQPGTHAHQGLPRARGPVQALGIGLVHGMGGSAGVGVLLVASIHDRAVAVLALGILALFTAVSMSLLSTGVGLTLSRRRVRASLPRIAPVLGVASLAFGAWYALGALELAPYVF